jgi:hypothetical protein
MTNPTMGGRLMVSVGGTTYVADPASKESFDRKKQKLQMANASRFNTIDYYDGDAECKVTVTKPVIDSDADFLTLLGLGATVADPTPTPIVFALPTRTTTVTNCVCDTVTLDFNRGKAIMITAEFLSTDPPDETAGYTVAPTATYGHVMYWKDIVNFFTIASDNLKQFSQFQVKLSHNLFPYYGIRDDGLTLPTSLTACNADVDGTFKKLLTDDADYAAFLLPCDVPGDIGIVVSPFCVTESPVILTITAKNCKYSAPVRDGAITQAYEETFKFMAENIAASNPLVATLAA